MTAIVIILPVPPSTNALFRNLPGGGRAKTRAYEKWTEQAGPIIRGAWADAGKPIMGKPLRLVIEAGFGHHRDVSNIIKPVEDAIVAAIPGCPDDKWNDEVTAARRDGLDPACVIATLSSMGAPPG